MQQIPISSGIYKIAHIESGRCYVGSAVNLRNRWLVHRHGLTNGVHHSKKLQRAWDKYGADAFQFVVIEIVSNKEKLITVEQEWIDKLSAYIAGFNCTPTAGSSLGRKFSESTLKKMSKARLGLKMSDESRLLMSQQRKGKPKTEEHRAKIAASNLGKVMSEESRARMSAAWKIRASRPLARLPNGKFAKSKDVRWTEPGLYRDAA